ncbi:MAG TPA: acyl-CoA dehydrogenase family protein [Solirubrobacteraceae bacterium]|jgi:acyl-CoA dehydrogenase
MLGSAVSIVDLAAEIGENIAAPVADEVDRDSRFPREAVDAFRERRLLSALVPEELGGYGASMSDISGAVRALARHCSASALVLAMHSIEVNNLVRQGSTEPLQELQRQLASDQLLFANANSEVGIGGDVGRSNCALENDGGTLRLTKDCLAISYGAYADVIAATARRSPDSEPTDQVQALCRRFTLEPLSEWDAIGLRGTCSLGYRLQAEIEAGELYPLPFSEIATSGGLQANMLFLSSVWVGIAESAAAKAHAYVRAAARREIGTTPKSALRLAELSADLDGIRALLETSAHRIQNADGTDELGSIQLLASLRNLKVGASEGGVRIVRDALEICGIAGFKRGTPFTLDRQLRDAHGGLVMVSNDRYLHMNADTLVARKQL